MPPTHYTARGFRNPSPKAQPPRPLDMLKWAWIRFRAHRLWGFSGTPPTPMTPAFPSPRAAPGELTVTWVGHSTFLVQVGTLNILTDPIWSERCMPVQWAGPRRHAPPGIPFNQLPPIDIVLQSHDHYDHFDDWSVRALARAHPDARWYTSLGVARRLRSRSVRHVTELDWWQFAGIGDEQVTCVPAQHLSGRTPFDRNSMLWSGFVLKTGGRSLYFVGDTGWHHGFDEIGERAGPFDAVLMPIGAYDPRWVFQWVHMNPEEAVRAFDALTASHPTSAPVMVAMHWGTFVLTDEPMDEPPRLARAAWDAAKLPGQRLWIMAPGETRRMEPS